jgi:hypothetical protein
MNLKPSCLISKAQPAPVGTVRLIIGRHGSMNPKGRKAASSVGQLLRQSLL